MYAPAGVKTNHNEFPIPNTQRAWVLGEHGQKMETSQVCSWDNPWLRAI